MIRETCTNCRSFSEVLISLRVTETALPDEVSVWSFYLPSSMFYTNDFTLWGLFFFFFSHALLRLALFFFISFALIAIRWLSALEPFYLTMSHATKASPKLSFSTPWGEGREAMPLSAGEMLDGQYQRVDIPELLTVAPCRKDWKRISAESAFMSPRPLNRSREMGWTELYCQQAMHWLTLWDRFILLISITSALHGFGFTSVLFR